MDNIVRNKNKFFKNNVTKKKKNKETKTKKITEFWKKSSNPVKASLLLMGIGHLKYKCFTRQLCILW